MGTGLAGAGAALRHLSPAQAAAPTAVRPMATIDGRPISARVVDAGDARVEVDPGDWAILKVK